MLDFIPNTGIEYPFKIGYPLFEKKTNDFEKLYTFEN